VSRASRRALRRKRERLSSAPPPAPSRPLPRLLLNELQPHEGPRDADAETDRPTWPEALRILEVQPETPRAAPPSLHAPTPAGLFEVDTLVDFRPTPLGAPADADDAIADIEHQFFAAAHRTRPVNDIEDDVTTLARRSGVPRELPFLRLIVVVLAACTFLCIAAVLERSGPGRLDDARVDARTASPAQI
jgi:hypothetical protein